MAGGPWGRGALALAAMAVLAGCDLVGLGTDTGLELNWDVVGEGVANPEVQVTGGLSSIGVSGNFVVELPCQPLAGNIQERNSEITFTVTALSDRALCSGDTTTLRYVAGILNLEPGERFLTVVHAIEDRSRPPETVFEGAVEVR